MIAGLEHPDRVLRLVGMLVSPSVIPVINRETRAFPVPCKSFNFKTINYIFVFVPFHVCSIESGAVKRIGIRSEK